MEYCEINILELNELKSNKYGKFINILKSAEKAKTNNYRCEGGMCCNCIYTKLTGSAKGCNPQTFRNVIDKFLNSINY